jgi:CBS domain-containing protein
MKTVKDLLKNKEHDIWSISPNATVFEALQLIGEKEIGALIVKDGEEVVGVVSERDYARKVILKGKTSMTTLVKEVMSSPAVSVKPENTVEECMVLMTAKRIRHLPVFDKGKLVGIISIGDVVKSIISEQEKLIEQLSDYIAGKYV